mgnify:CR=1 FL=1
MACLGYFSKNTRELRMPRTSGHRDSLGARWDGRVTNGELSPEHALSTADLKVRLTPEFRQRERHFGRRTEQLDPVLQSHMTTK